VIRTLIVDDEPLSRERIRALLAAYREIEVIGECGDGQQAVQTILTERPDLVFLDVQMPELDGFEVVRTVSDEYVPAIVFVTAFDHYALRAFEVHPVDYLLKPIHPERFDKAVRHAIERLASPDRQLLDFVRRLRQERRYPQRFVVRSAGRISFVRISNVDWIDAADNYVRLHAGGREHLVRDTLTAFESKVNPEKFVRVHRSIIINLDRVESIEPHAHGEYVVTMKDGARLTTSRSYSDRLRLILR
jgi:two-component system, LytTR family, response regulator